MLAKQAGRERGQAARCHAVPQQLPLGRGERRAARPHPPGAPGQPALLSPGPRPPARTGGAPGSPREPRSGGGAAEAAALALLSGGRGAERSPSDGRGRARPARGCSVGRAARHSPARVPQAPTGRTPRWSCPRPAAAPCRTGCRWRRARRKARPVPAPRGTWTFSSSSWWRPWAFPGAAPTAAPLRSDHPAPLRSHARGEGGTAGRAGAGPLPAQPCRPRRSRPALTWQPAPPFQTRPPPLRPLPALESAATGDAAAKGSTPPGGFPEKLARPDPARGNAVQYRPVPTARSVSAAATWPSGALRLPRLAGTPRGRVPGAEPPVLLAARRLESSNVTKHYWGVHISTPNLGSFHCNLNSIGVVYSRSTRNLQPAPFLLQATDAHGLVEEEGAHICVYI